MLSHIFDHCQGDKSSSVLCLETMLGKCAAGMAKRKRSDLDDEEEDLGEGPASPRGMPESQGRSGQDLLEEEAEEQNAQRSTQDQVIDEPSMPI